MEYQETQRFNNTWHYVLFLAIIGLTIGTATFNYFYMESTRSSIIGGFSSFAIVCILWFSMKLKTRIDTTGIHYRYTPFHLKERTLNWNEIQTVEIKEYRPLQDYGGWGIRFKGFDFNNILLNVAGTKGIHVHLKSGKRIMIGTQQPYEADQALERFKSIS